jgi:hypothetical protein
MSVIHAPWQALSGVAFAGDRPGRPLRVLTDNVVARTRMAGPRA